MSASNHRRDPNKPKNTAKPRENKYDESDPQAWRRAQEDIPERTGRPKKSRTSRPSERSERSERPERREQTYYDDDPNNDYIGEPPSSSDRREHKSDHKINSGSRHHDPSPASGKLPRDHTQKKSTKMPRSGPKITEEKRQAVKMMMEKLVNEIKEKMEMLTKLKGTPKDFRDALLNDNTIKRLKDEVNSTTIGERKLQRDLLKEWRWAVDNKGEISKPIECSYMRDWLALDKKFSLYQEGIKTDKENIDAYYDPGRKIKELERELDDDQLKMECLAYRIGMDFKAYFKEKLPLYYSDTDSE